MPRLDKGESGDNTQDFDISGYYGYSGERIDKLLADEYTLVTIVLDQSPSVTRFKKDMEKALKEVIRACADSPRADNLMLRLVMFSDTVDEFHGFRQLADCNPDDYDGCIQPNGLTALYSATESSVRAMNDYSTAMKKSFFRSNGIVFVITDGDDNCSKTATPHTVRQALSKVVQDEVLESLITVLIGVNIKDGHMERQLKMFKDEAGLTKFIPVEDSVAKTLARIAEFMSKSISAQSQSLGTGAPSTSLSF